MATVIATSMVIARAPRDIQAHPVICVSRMLEAIHAKQHARGIIHAARTDVAQETDSMYLLGIQHANALVASLVNHALLAHSP